MSEEKQLTDSQICHRNGCSNTIETTNIHVNNTNPKLSMCSHCMAEFEHSVMSSIMEGIIKRGEHIDMHANFDRLLNEFIVTPKPVTKCSRKGCTNTSIDHPIISKRNGKGVMTYICPECKRDFTIYMLKDTILNGKFGGVDGNKISAEYDKFMDTEKGDAISSLKSVLNIIALSKDLTKN